MLNDMIQPILIHGPGCCPECHYTLTIADRELNLMKLNHDGSVIELISTDVICNAICPKCGNTIRMMRSNGIYKPYSERVIDFDRLDLERILDMRSKGKYTIEGNPFLDI